MSELLWVLARSHKWPSCPFLKRIALANGGHLIQEVRSIPSREPIIAQWLADRKIQSPAPSFQWKKLQMQLCFRILLLLMLSLEYTETTSLFSSFLIPFVKAILFFIISIMPAPFTKLLKWKSWSYIWPCPSFHIKHPIFKQMLLVLPSKYKPNPIFFNTSTTIPISHLDYCHYPLIYLLLPFWRLLS